MDRTKKFKLGKKKISLIVLDPNLKVIKNIMELGI